MYSQAQRLNQTSIGKPKGRRLLSRRALLRAGLGTALLALLPLGAEFRIEQGNQPLTDDWSRIPVKPRGSAFLGISFRPHSTQAFGLEVRPTLNTLLEYPIQMVRLGAYWNNIAPQEHVFDTNELDWEIDAVERAGAKIILCVGALKTFGFPEYFIPQRYIRKPFADGTLFTPTTHPELLDAATTFISRIVDRYKGRQSIVAWQLENEPADPIYFARNWRLSTDFVKRELASLRIIDRSKPILITGGLVTSLTESIVEAWLTRDQGGSLALAKEAGDIIGLDYYPRVGITSIGSENMYLNTSEVPWGQGDREGLAQWARSHGQKIMVAEGQAEPWEPPMVPPSPKHYALYSCTPQNLIENYNAWAGCTECLPLYAYLFWGADYWILRWKQGDQQYLRAFAKVLEQA